MECGVSEYTCQFIEWVLKNSKYLSDLPKAVGTWDGGWLLALIKEHGERLVAIASLTFGIYKWWVYRERILHKRLEEYITESDKRLQPASSQVVEALLRPGRVAALPQPSFAVDLRNILYRTRWFFGLGFITPEAEAKWRLGTALGGIRKRIQTSRQALRSLQDQQAQLHIIAGAVATSRARSTKFRAASRRHDQRALREFKKALLVPGHQRNLAAKENEAIQLLRLGRADLALEAFVELEAIAGEIPEEKKRDILLARSRRYQAQIKMFTSYGAAWILIAADNGTSSIDLRDKHGPYQAWELIEQAETHYVSAYVAKLNGFKNREPLHLRRTGERYDDALASTQRWLARKGDRELRKIAAQGLARVQKAQRGEYDLDWLSFGLHEPKNQPAPIGGNAGH